jgi:hypothetical protein
MVCDSTGLSSGFTIILKRNTKDLEVTAMNGRGSGSERLTATHACIQPGAGATPHSDEERKLAPPCGEEENQQNMEHGEHKKGLVAGNYIPTAAQWDRRYQH